jgi:hypothetical protein
MEATRWTIASAGRALFQAASRNLPRLLTETGVEALVLDTIHMYLEVVPMSMASKQRSRIVPWSFRAPETITLVRNLVRPSDGRALA